MHPFAKPERNAEVVKMHRDGKSMRTIARHFVISEARVRQILGADQAHRLKKRCPRCHGSGEVPR